jgi:DNA-binding beta-propeller fold protein YncE
VTGNPGSDQNHFAWPGRLAVDSGGRLYVVDTGNNRVQRCSFSGTWSCTTFGGGAGVSSLQGINVDQANNVYIHDGSNGRVVKCDTGGVCSGLVTGMLYSRDLAADSGGNVYAGGYGHGVIQKYNSSGGLIGDFVGTFDQAFVPDASHIYSPWGIAAAADGSIYVAERFGYRLLKLDASGKQTWAIGRPGGWGGDNDYLNCLEGKPTVAANGNVYLPDTGNNRIQVFSSSGTYVATFGSCGAGNDNLNWPTGVAINTANGDIYVADRDNRRVQVYDSSSGYKATLGVTGASGSDAAHFNPSSRCGR